MNDVPFYKTRMGEKFYCGTRPELVRQLEHLLPGQEDKPESEEEWPCRALPGSPL